MESQNEEKAIEFATSYDGKIISFAHLAALQMGAWKDEQYKQEKQQWIDKAAEWFGKYLFDIGYPDDWLRDSPNTTNGETRFKQAMKGE